MRIAYLHGATIPSRAASTVQVMKMCEAFASLGHDVLLLSPDKPDVESGVDDIHAHYGVKPVFRMSRASWVPLPGRQYLCAVDMVAQLRRFKADIVFSRFATAGLFAAWCGARVIHELHRPLKHSAPGEARIIRTLLRSRRLVSAVTISQALRREYEKDLPQLKGRTIVAHDGADVGGEYAPRGPQPDNGPLRVGYIGSLYPGRGVELIIGLARECPFAEFHIVGGTGDEIAHFRSDLGGLTNISFHGFRPHPVALRLLADFDVVLAPYGSKVGVYGAPETDTSPYMSPLKLFEYMAAGKAIICSDHEVLQEVVRNEETALICERGNVAQWSVALTRLWKEPELRRALGARAREVCVQQYSWRSRAERVLSKDHDEGTLCH